jgi:AraC family transcriptional activator of pobA
VAGDGPLAVDRLPDPTDPVQVVRMDVPRFSAADIRAPHRHDYHELLWLRSGHGEHLLDGRPLAVRPRTLTLIGRGQVHVFSQAEDVVGAAVRFGDEALLGGDARRATPGWMLAGRGGLAVEVPEGEVARLESIIAALEAETARPPDARSAELERHLLAVLLLWIERWNEDTRTERRDADDAEVQLHRRFAERLEADYAHRHDAAHYARALACAEPRHRPHHEGARDRPRDARGGAAAALHRAQRPGGRPPDRLPRPAVLLARVQAPPGRGAAGLSRARAGEVHASMRLCHSRGARGGASLAA